jgi:hypothetical protein
VRLKWRSPVAPDWEGRGFEPWVRELDDTSGVYLIRDTQTREVVYIGESHTGRLRETLTRHLYAWRGRGSGPSYHPALVEVAIIEATTPLDDPVADQYALIERYQPRDNTMDGHTLWWRMANRNPRRRRYDA